MSSASEAPPAPARVVLFVGPQWHGSDSTGLARALRRLGHVVVTADDDPYFPQGQSFALKVARRLLRPLFEREYNAHVRDLAETVRPDLVVVYKGLRLRPDTLAAVKQWAGCAVLAYPDTSFSDDGPLIPGCLPLYDRVFTTKSFHLDYLRAAWGLENVELLHHGFDPDIHRPLRLGAETLAAYGCDASFIGNWSPKKAVLLAHLAQAVPALKLRVWGPYWERARDAFPPGVLQFRALWGDAYMLALQSSKIAVALLRERLPGGPSGDLVTARTFQIPACGAFMLHERTEELLQFYREGEEVACFDGPEELAAKVQFYLAHEQGREQIRAAGYRRCLAEHDQLLRARRIVDFYEERRTASPTCTKSIR